MLSAMKINKSTKHRGALYIEYALLFALIVFVGLFFISDKGFGNGISSIYTKVEQLLSGEDKTIPAGTNILGKQNAAICAWYEGKDLSNYYRMHMDGTVELEPNTNYTFTISVPDGFDMEQYRLDVGLWMVSDASGVNNNVLGDSGWISNNSKYSTDTGAKTFPYTSTFDSKTNTYTVTFNTGEQTSYFTTNLKVRDKKANSDAYFLNNTALQSQVNSAMQNATLVKNGAAKKI